jgi:hypothetical protein
MNIYDLSSKETELKAKYFALDPEDPEDAAEIELIERQLDAIDASAQRKIIWRVRVLKEMEAELEAVEERKRHIERKRVTAANAVDRMKANIADAMTMFGLEKVQDEEFSVSYKLNGATAKIVGLDDFEIRQLPMDCWDTIPETYKPKLNAIKALLKTTEIDGLELVVSKSLRIS